MINKVEMLRLHLNKILLLKSVCTVLALQALVFISVYNIQYTIDAPKRRFNKCGLDKNGVRKT